MAYKLGPTDKKKKTAFLESRFAQASSTKKIIAVISERRSSQFNTGSTFAAAKRKREKNFFAGLLRDRSLFIFGGGVGGFFGVSMKEKT